MIRIGHASISEKNTINGKKGDSTGKEVCVRTWYSKPWDFVAVHPDETVREKHAKAVEEACANGCIGYGQNDRNSLNDEAKKVNYALSKIKVKCNCDCSSLQNVCAVASGAVSSYVGWRTSTMKAYLEKAGYIILTGDCANKSEYAVRGAIYVKSGKHTVCALDNGAKSNDTLAECGFAYSEKPMYKVGSVYTLQANMSVRFGAGTGFAKKSHTQLTADGQKHDSNLNGTLDRGTKVTVKEIVNVRDDVWLRIPSGYIAGYYKGKIYVK